MINPEAKLRDDIFSDGPQEPTRKGFGKGLVEAGEKDEKIVALCADLTESTQMLAFKEKFPARYVEMGVAEQNLAGVASGLANWGKIPFISSYATFSPGRNNEQIRTAICINNMPVKVVGSHAGVSVGPDGGSHQALEDIALMRALPRMTVISPCDAEEARKATLAAAVHDGPVYLRLAREKTPVMTTAETPFEFGRVLTMWESEHGGEVVIFATGPLVYQALCAARELEHEIPVAIINVHTIKPLDTAGIVAAARAAGAVVTVEEHQIAGGMGSAIAEVLARECPTPMEFVGVNDRFGQSGEPGELIKHYGMDARAIAEAVRKAAGRKQ